MSPVTGDSNRRLRCAIQRWGCLAATTNYLESLWVLHMIAVLATIFAIGFSFIALAGLTIEVCKRNYRREKWTRRHDPSPRPSFSNQVSDEIGHLGIRLLVAGSLGFFAFLLVRDLALGRV